MPLTTRKFQTGQYVVLVGQKRILRIEEFFLMRYAGEDFPAYHTSDASEATHDVMEKDIDRVVFDPTES